MKAVATSLCLLALSLSAADDLGPLIEEALDQAVHLNVTDQTLADAFAGVAEETGITVTIAPETLELLPYGANTKVTARMENISLREGLSQLTDPLGLKFEVRERGLEVVPTAALLRVGKRATWDELDALAELRGLDFTTGEPALETLLSRLQFQFSDVDGWPPLQAAVMRIGAGPGDEVLTLACDSLGWTWYPTGKHIAILRKTDQIQRQLQVLVSMRESHRKLADVLQQIGAAAGVTVRCEPSAITSLPLTTRQNFSLFVENKTAADALELVAATTGLGYRIDPDAVVFYHPSQPPEQVPQPDEAKAHRSADPYVGKIILPPAADGTQVELLIRESDLTPDVIELRRRQIERANEAIREALLKIEQQAGQ